MSLLGGNQYLGQFLLLDIGNPMNAISIKLVKESLLNILSLASCLHGVSRIPVFGCGVIDSELHILRSWDFLTGNYSIVDRHLNCLEDFAKMGVIVPITNYITVLESSILKIVNDFDEGVSQWRCQTESKNKFDVHRYWPSKFQLTLITKKSIFTVAEVLKDNSQLGSLARLKTFQLLELTSDDTKLCGVYGNATNVISCNVIAESMAHLDEFFKTWLLVNQRNKEHLRIVLNEEVDFHIKCDLNDCILNPVNLPISQNFTLSANFPTLIAQKPLVMNEYKAPLHQLVVTSRIAISDICPSLLFGFPQRIYPTQNVSLTWDECRKNLQLFNALCRQLNETGLGIVTKIKQPSPFDQISALHFLISDGEELLMKNLVPVELKLPPRPVTLPSSHAEPPEDVEQEACRTVCSFLNQIDVMHEYSPEQHSIGIYDHIRKHVKSLECSRASFMSEKESPITSKMKRRDGKATSPYLRAHVTHGEYTPPFLADASTSSDTVTSITSNQTRKISKRSVASTNENAPNHPALMSPASIAKYRKRNSGMFDLPEWTEPGIEE